jgi:hypothetical protein
MLLPQVLMVQLRHTSALSKLNEALFFLAFTSGRIICCTGLAILSLGAR